MPKINHVAKARQTYEMVPDLDPETGQQKVVTLTGRTRRKGGEITRRLTKPDYGRPKPAKQCDDPQCKQPTREISVGTPFKYIAIKRQHGGIERYRHEDCRNWDPWDYSDALWARVAQVQAQRVDVSGIASEEDAQSVAEELAVMITELADEKEEAADNMPDGLRDASELPDQIDSLRSWADELESISFPEMPSDECLECEGTGDNGKPEETDCTQCGGEGIVEPSDEEMDAWRDEVESEISGVLENAPL
jgi:hypothetical protein